MFTTSTKILKGYLQHKALRDGLYELFKYYLSKLGISSIVLDNSIIQRVLSIHAKSIKEFFDELSNDSCFWNYIIEKIVEAKRRERRAGGWVRPLQGALLYALVRVFQPEVVVETGVGPGGSSAFILNALERNGFGRLYSIDLPGYDKVYYPTIGKAYDEHIPPGFDVGWLIPPWLKSRWTLIIGDARTELPRLLKKLETIDMFLHDSLHTYNHMMFEYIVAHKHLKSSGLLLVMT